MSGQLYHDGRHDGFEEGYQQGWADAMKRVAEYANKDIDGNSGEYLDGYYRAMECVSHFVSSEPTPKKPE